MINYLKGRLVEKKPTYTVIECNGIGYYANVSLHTYSTLKEEENCKLFTHLVIREDAHTLYGFSTENERFIFKMLISVSGVGPNTARMILSSMTPSEVQQTIANEQVNALKAVKGIGAKTAERVIVDLKDKILSTLDDPQEMIIGNTSKEETLKALEVLGFSRKSSEKVIDKILRENPDLVVEEIIKAALANM